MPLVIVWFAILVGGATTFAVLHATGRGSRRRPAELQPAGKKIEEEGSDDLGTGGEGAKEEEGGGAKPAPETAARALAAP